MSEYRIKNVDWFGTIGAILLVLFLMLFPIINQCETEDSTACTWNAATHGNGKGHSFTNFYGVNIYHPWSFTE